MENEATIGTSESNQKSVIFTLGVCLLKDNCRTIGQLSVQRMDDGGCGFENYLDDVKFLSNSSLRDFIEKMLNVNDEQVLSYADLLSHRFLQDDEVSGADAIVAVAAANEEPRSFQKIDWWEVVQLAFRTIVTSSCPYLGINTYFTRSFKNLGSLGKGSYGEVLKAQHKTDGKIYAVKRIVSSKKQDIKEVELLSKLEHKYVVRYYSCWSEKHPRSLSEEEQYPEGLEGDTVHILYLQMEFCEKGTLEDAITSRQLIDDRKRVFRLFKEILEGISYVHGEGIVHGDLHAKNIFLDKEDRVKIGDFGLATKLRDVANLQNAIVDALQIDGDRNSTAAYKKEDDMYKLGERIFFEMLTRPSYTSTQRSKLLKTRLTLPEDFANRPENAKAVEILKWLLREKPSERPSANELLQSNLLKAFENAIVDERKP